MHSYFNELTKAEYKIYKKLNTPIKIQDFLETLPENFYERKDTCYSPRIVLQKRRAHCLEGAFLGASLLWYHGRPPLLLDLQAVDRDYDHVVAIYRQNGCWGAISKTNYAQLRFRDPVYKTIRELALSYFHEYFLDSGVKTMRKFSRPFDLSRYKKFNWITTHLPLWRIGDDLDDSPHYSIANKKTLRNLRPADPIEVQAGKLKIWSDSR